MDFSYLFHESSKLIAPEGGEYVPVDEHNWPAEWKEVAYKVYENVPHVALPVAERSGAASFIERRRSTRTYAKAPVSLMQLATLLRFSCGEMRPARDDVPARRAQPSGGALFPLEVYVIIFRPTTGLPAGVYHYAPAQHQLDVLWSRTLSASDIADLYLPSWVSEAAGVLAITAVFDRTECKYRERGYRYALIEAGHIGQNAYLMADALGLGCCALGGSFDERVEQLLDIDGISESLVYSIAFGVPPRDV